MTSTAPPSLPKALKAMRAATWLMESSLRVPFTKRRLGLDAVVGLVPVVGDALPIALTVVMIALAVYYKAPLHIPARMVLNATVDGLLGTIPLGLGDLLDVVFRSHRMNLELLEGHWLRQQGVEPTPWQDGEHEDDDDVIDVAVVGAPKA